MILFFLFSSFSKFLFACTLVDSRLTLPSCTCCFKAQHKVFLLSLGDSRSARIAPQTFTPESSSLDLPAQRLTWRWGPACSGDSACVFPLANYLYLPETSQTIWAVFSETFSSETRWLQVTEFVFSDFHTLVQACMHKYTRTICHIQDPLHIFSCLVFKSAILTSVEAYWLFCIICPSFFGPLLFVFVSFPCRNSFSTASLVFYMLTSYITCINSHLQWLKTRMTLKTYRYRQY